MFWRVISRPIGILSFPSPAEASASTACWMPPGMALGIELQSPSADFHPRIVDAGIEGGARRHRRWRGGGWLVGP